MLTFPRLRQIRRDAGISRATLAKLTLLNEDYLREIEIGEVEPFWDDYIALHKVLSQHVEAHRYGPTTVFCTFVGRYALADCVQHDALPSGFARAGWIAGKRLPISAALDLTLDFGLNDPAELNALLIHRQIWEIVSLSERNPEGAGWCPWCGADVVGGEPHHDACLPHNMWGLRDTDVAAATSMHNAFVPQRKGKVLVRSMKAYGLRRLREARGINQSQLARETGQSQSAISAIESGKRALTTRMATVLSVYFGCDESELYLKPEYANTSA